jgi:HAD superfamily hydrolase (TIGR01450 family)
MKADFHRNLNLPREMTMEQKSPPQTTINALIDTYEALLLDAYGVLVTHDGALPDAAKLISHLNEIQKPYFIVTNDASRSAETSSERYTHMGLHIPPQRIITSGMLITRYFAEHGLRGKTCFVLGTADSLRYVEAAGGNIVALDPLPALCSENPHIQNDGAVDGEVLVVCDEHGFPLLETLDATLTVLYDRLDRGRFVYLLLPNPDLVYPAGRNRFGFTAGAMAVMIEKALAHRYPHRTDLVFTALGKPHPPIFEEAVRRAATRDLVMIGDQLATDIQGAHDFGIPAVLATTGLSHWPARGNAPCRVRPDFIVDSLTLER